MCCLSITLRQEILSLNSVLPFQTLDKFEHSVLSTVWTVVDSMYKYCLCSDRKMAELFTGKVKWCSTEQTCPRGKRDKD